MLGNLIAPLRNSHHAELQQEIQKESTKYIRHSLRSASATAGQALSPKDNAIPQIVSAHYAEIDRLAAEKEALANRLVQLVSRARARLDHDLSKVLVLQGELDPSVQAGPFSSAATKTPIDKLNDTLRTAITIPEAPATPIMNPGPPPQKSACFFGYVTAPRHITHLKYCFSPLPTGSTLFICISRHVRSVRASDLVEYTLVRNTERRTGTATASTGSIKLPSPAPMSAMPYGTGQRSRLSQQVHPRQSPLRSRRRTASNGLDADEDAEGEDDVDDAMEEGGDAEDKELYCFCQKLSYGEVRRARSAWWR